MTLDQWVASTEALLALDAKGALVPHGIGGHARTLLEDALARATARPVPTPVGVNGIDPEILRRYETMIEDQGIRWPECVPDPGTDLAHLKWMLTQMYGGMAEDKAGRWLGFIQGCLIARGLTTVTEERNFTRPFFATSPQTSEAGE